MLETYLASLWKPADERAIPSPSEKDRTQSIIDELQRMLDFETSIIENTSKIVADHQWRARILEGELQKRKLFIAPIRKAPDDVLVEILDLALIGARRQIWRFSRVCRHWRQLCCSYARLWSHIEVDLAVDRPHVGLVSKWRERARGTNQTIDLQLHLEQFGALKSMLEGGLKYITHLRLTISFVRNTPPKCDLPPALPCLQYLALNNGAHGNQVHFFEAQAYVTSLCQQFFTRKQTRRTGSVARFHLEFYNLGFSTPLRVFNCVHTVALRSCAFTGPSEIFQFLEAARFTVKHLEYSDCRTMYSETLPHTRPLTFPSLLTLKHYTDEYFAHHFSILPILSCPTLKVLTTQEHEAKLCTVAQFPAIQELCVAKTGWNDARIVNCPLVRDSRQLETLAISQGPSSPSLDPSSIVRHYPYVNLDMFTGSLRRIRFHLLPYVRGPVEQLESRLREVTNDFARRGRDIEFELIRGGD